ncbi:MAG: thermonuclease family protein [Nitrospirota bacterium]|nr:thermonuclease family protein [Nitrospirota bacterium]
MNDRFSKVFWVILVLCVFLLFATRGISAPDAGKGSGNTVWVEKIYDGDTIGGVVDSRFEKIRLIGIDTPEMEQRPWGRKARKCLKSLLAATDAKILLEYDVERRDKYGRILGYIWMRDGRLINEELLKEGFAVLLTIPPNVKYEKRFRVAQRRARESKTGIWGKDGLQESPYEYRKEHPWR